VKRAIWATPLVIVLAASAAAACTGVVLVGDGHVVVGSNEDNLATGPAMWATAATHSSCGAVYFGFRFPAMGGRFAGWYEMQGANDHGLYFDLFSTPCRSESSQSQCRPPARHPWVPIDLRRRLSEP
jgi:hypothetical protein